MNKILIVDTPRISAWVYPERGIVHHQMKAYCYGPEFRDALSKTADAMVRYHATSYLSDNLAGGALTREDSEWAGKFWLPRAFAAGWKRWAIVQPASVIGQISVKRYTTTDVLTAREIATRLFSDAEEAMKWLEEA